jgi:hypothetical protein
MIKSFKTGLFCCGLLLAACGAPQSDTVEIPTVPEVGGSPEAPETGAVKRDISNYTMALAQFADLEVGEPMDVTVAKIKNYLKPEGEGEGNMSVSWETTDAGAGEKTFTGLADNMTDDSLKAQEVMAVFKESGDGSYRLTKYGARIKCWRGDNKDAWTTDLCP